MERILHILSDGDVDLVCRVQKEFEETGKSKLPDDILNKVFCLIGDLIWYFRHLYGISIWWMVGFSFG